jgi:hypothetical protein
LRLPRVSIGMSSRLDGTAKTFRLHPRKTERWMTKNVRRLLDIVHFLGMMSNAIFLPFIFLSLACGVIFTHILGTEHRERS